MYTLLVQIEGSLNSRPLTPIWNDPNDLAFFTPSRYLTGGSYSFHLGTQFIIFESKHTQREFIVYVWWDCRGISYHELLKPKLKVYCGEICSTIAKNIFMQISYTCHSQKCYFFTRQCGDARKNSWAFMVYWTVSTLLSQILI